MIPFPDDDVDEDATAAVDPSCNAADIAPCINALSLGLPRDAADAAAAFDDEDDGCCCCRD